LGETERDIHLVKGAEKEPKKKEEGRSKVAEETRIHHLSRSIEKDVRLCEVRVNFGDDQS